MCPRGPGSGFVMHELRTNDPALDMRVFRSGRFNAAVTAGAMFNIVLGGSMVLLAGVLVLRSFDLNTSRTVVFVTTALIVVGGALVTTPQATIMLGSAPADLGGAVSAVKSAVNEGGYSLGPALLALVGINLFLTDSVHDLSRSGITRAETRAALLTTHGGREAHMVDQASHAFRRFSRVRLSVVSRVSCRGAEDAMEGIPFGLRPPRPRPGDGASSRTGDGPEQHL